MANQLLVSKDKNKLNIDVIYNFLSNSYWGKNRSKEEVSKSINHSHCFGMYLNNQQIGFARVVTDSVFFGYLMDEFVLKEHQGKGYASKLLEVVMNDKEMCDIQKWLLATADAHQLYRKFGFNSVTPNLYMEYKKH